MKIIYYRQLGEKKCLPRGGREHFWNSPNHRFPFWTNGKVVVLGVPILKHFRVDFFICLFAFKFCIKIVHVLDGCAN